MTARVAPTSRDAMLELVALVRGTWRELPSGLVDSRAPAVLELCDVVERLLAKADLSMCVWCGHEGPRAPEAMFEHVVTCEKRLAANDRLLALALERGKRMALALFEIVEVDERGGEGRPARIALRGLGLVEDEPTGATAPTGDPRSPGDGTPGGDGQASPGVQGGAAAAACSTEAPRCPRCGELADVEIETNGKIEYACEEHEVEVRSDALREARAELVRTAAPPHRRDVRAALRAKALAFLNSEDREDEVGPDHVSALVRLLEDVRDEALRTDYATNKAPDRDITKMKRCHLAVGDTVVHEASGTFGTVVDVGQIEGLIWIDVQWLGGSDRPHRVDPDVLQRMPRSETAPNKPGGNGC